jgi:hypothetical protein
MNARRFGMILLLAAGLGLGLLAFARILLWLEPRGRALDPQRAAASIPIAVLGDSDSHSYQDSIWYPADGAERGGEHHAATFQWTEVLARLRPEPLDLGEWGRWGSRSLPVRLLDPFGVRARAPRKEDFRYNLAFAGARGSDLMTGIWRQAPRLLDMMDEDAARWRRGVVIIRIGVVDFGYASSLDRLAANPQDPEVRAAMDGCLRHVRASLDLIHSRHPETRAVLVGIFDNSHFPSYLEFWHSRAALDNISAGLDYFDGELRALAAADPRLAFFDDRAWFASLWGSRDAHGLPAYLTVAVGKELQVENSAGDAPGNAVLSDGHAGVVWNTLWAQALVKLLNDSFHLAVAPITNEEAERFLKNDLRLKP